jgi:glycosyltransferase involved in cell wall biosynthesis
MSSVAGVVLTLNEAADLPRALASLAWCDERLVVDSGSSDATLSIAAAAGVRCQMHRQPGRFLISDQRNWALDHGDLQSEWVLFLDADEEITPACADAIRVAIAAPNAPAGFELTPRYWFLGRWLRHTQGYPNWHPRLLRRACLRFEGGVWESFSNPEPIGRIHEPYEHYAFSKGIDDWLQRHQRYAAWEAEKILACLDGGGSAALATRRWPLLRLWAARLWPLRPIARFSQKYLLQAGWREGWQGLLFALLMAGYDLITVVKVIQLTRQRQGLPL